MQGMQVLVCVFITVGSLLAHYRLTIGGYLSRFGSLEAGDCVSLVLLIGSRLGYRLMEGRCRVCRCWSVCLLPTNHYWLTIDSLLAHYWWL